MSDDDLIDGWLDEWEAQLGAGGLPPAEFARRRNLPAGLVAEFVRRGQALRAADAGLAGTAFPSDFPSPPARAAGVAAQVLAPGVEPEPGCRLVRLCGRGGFGEVWEARCPDGRPIALKFVPRRSAAGEAERLACELLVSARHPNLLRVFRTFAWGDWLVIESDLAAGTLGDWARERSGEIAVYKDRLVWHMRDVAAGLDYLNGADIVHRDVKPANLLLVRGVAKVGDLGLVKELRDGFASHSGGLTLSYAAPEFFDGLTTLRSDQYSLAVAYCELRGGRLPFAGTQHQVVRGHILGTPDLSMLPAAEQPIVARALAKEPNARFASCTAFVAELIRVNGRPERGELNRLFSWPDERRHPGTLDQAALRHIARRLDALLDRPPPSHGKWTLC